MHITEEENWLYGFLFSLVDPDGYGVALGSSARNVLEKSGLNRGQLEHVIIVHK